MSTTTSKPRRRWRKVLIGLGAVLVALVLLVGLAPLLVSLGVGQGALAAAAERRINGTVSFDELSLRWFGSQKVTGLIVRGADGRTAAELDLGVDAGLLALLTGRVEALEVEVAGALSGEVRRDGSTSFADLWDGTEPRDEAGSRASATPGDVVLPPGLPSMTVRITSLRVELSDAEAPTVAVFDGLSGEFAFEPGGPAGLHLSGTTGGGSKPGSIELTLDTTGVFDERGGLSLDRASVNLDVTVRNVPVLAVDRPTELTDLHLTASSDALADHLAIGLEAAAEIEGAEAGRLEADLALEQPVRPDGTLTLDLGRITGRVTGNGVPTALLQGTFAGTPVVLTRDIGPTFDIEADFSADQAPGEARNVSVTVDADAVNVEFAGVVDPNSRSIAGRVFKVFAEISPQLVAAVTGLHPDRRAGVQIDFDRLSIPPHGDSPGAQFAGTAVTGTLELTSPVAIARRAGAAPMFTLDRLLARVNAEALGDGMLLGGSAAVDGAEAAFDVSLSGYLAEDGSLDFARAVSKGAVALRDVHAATLARLMPAQAALIASAVEQPVDVEVVTAFEAGEPRVAITAGNDQHDVSATVTRAGETLRLSEARATLTVTPGIVTALQEGSERPFTLAEAVRVSLELEPMDLPMAAGPLSIAGTAALRRVIDDEALTDVRYELNLVGQEGAFALRRADVRLSNVMVSSAEMVLGRPPGSLRRWLGLRGNAQLTTDLGADALTATIGGDFPKLQGEFAASVRGDVLTVDSGEASLGLSREVIQSRVDLPAANAPAGPPARRPPQPRMTVAADVPLSLEVRSLRLPRAILSGQPLDPAAVRVDLRLTGGPLHLDETTEGRSTIDDLDIVLSGDDLTKGLGLRITGTVTAGGIREPGALEVTGRLTDLVGDDGAFAPRQASLQMTAEASGLPAAAVDAVFGWQGLLTAAVGTRIDSFTAEASDLSRNTGTLETRIETPNGWLEATALGRNNALQILGKSPLEAEVEITPPLRERLLSRIHPLLGDIRSTEQPVRAKLGGAVIPLDGNVSRLQGNVGITVGKVEFDSGSITLALLRATNATNTATLPGRIEPIVAQIRDGILTYERFAVHIEQYTLLFSGQMNLVNRTLDLRWEMPLDGLTVSITELKGKVEGITVPMWTHGTFDEYKTEIHPDFKIEEVLLDVGIRTIFDELFKNADW